MCGMFLLEDSKSIVDMLVAQGKDRAAMEKELSWYFHSAPQSSQSIMQNIFHQANIVQRCGWRISEEGGMIHHQEIFRAGGMTRLDFLITALLVVGGHYKKHRAHRGDLKH